MVVQSVKNLRAMQEMRVLSLGLENSPGGGNGNPLQCSCLGNPMERRAWWTPVHGVSKSQTQLRTQTLPSTIHKRLSRFHFCEVETVRCSRGEGHFETGQWRQASLHTVPESETVRTRTQNHWMCLVGLPVSSWEERTERYICLFLIYFLIEGKLLYNVMMVSAIRQHKSAIIIHISPPPLPSAHPSRSSRTPG